MAAGWLVILGLRVKNLRVLRKSAPNHNLSKIFPITTSDIAKSKPKHSKMFELEDFSKFKKGTTVPEDEQGNELPSPPPSTPSDLDHSVDVAAEEEFKNMIHSHHDDLEDVEAIQVVPDSDKTKTINKHEESNSCFQSSISSPGPSSSQVQEHKAVIQIHHVDSVDDDEAFSKVILVVPENSKETTSNQDQEESMSCSNSIQVGQSPITSPRPSFSPVQAILRKPQEESPNLSVNFDVSNPSHDESQHNIIELLTQRRESAVSSMNRSNNNAARQNRKAVQNLLLENKKGMYRLS